MQKLSLNTLLVALVFLCSVLGFAEPKEPNFSGNYYEILVVEQDASAEEIRTSFKNLSLRYHPDSALIPDPQNGERFGKIKQAYDVLRDANKRAAYDKTLEYVSISEEFGIDISRFLKPDGGPLGNGIFHDASPGGLFGEWYSPDYSNVVLDEILYPSPEYQAFLRSLVTLKREHASGGLTQMYATLPEHEDRAEGDPLFYQYSLSRIDYIGGANFVGVNGLGSALPLIFHFIFAANVFSGNTVPGLVGWAVSPFVWHYFTWYAINDDMKYARSVDTVNEYIKVLGLAASENNLINGLVVFDFIESVVRKHLTIYNINTEDRMLLGRMFKLGKKDAYFRLGWLTRYLQYVASEQKDEVYWVSAFETQLKADRQGWLVDIEHLRSFLPEDSALLPTLYRLEEELKALGGHKVLASKISSRAKLVTQVARANFRVLTTFIPLWKGTDDTAPSTPKKPNEAVMIPFTRLIHGSDAGQCGKVLD